MVKAWPAGGDRRLGLHFLKSTFPFVFGQPFGSRGFREVLALKGRIDEKIAAAQETERHVKLGKGGIREIEFIVQSLQVGFGAKRVAIRERNTIKALGKLYRSKLLTEAEYTTLREAYLFLRDLENKLQMVNDAQTHLLPAAPKELRACALRLGYADERDQTAADHLLADYARHTKQVHQFFLHLLHSPPTPMASKGRRVKGTR